MWLLHGVNQPSVSSAASAAGKSADAGDGGVSYDAAPTVIWREGAGVLRVHPVLPRKREVMVRGGPGWDFWTPGDDHGGAWGSGQNWPLEPFEGGPLPSDPFLVRMWKTFWGPTLDRLEPSNRTHVVPGGWRMEVSPGEPALDDRFLHVMEIGDDQMPALSRVEPIEGHRLAGAIAGTSVLLFAIDPSPALDGEVTLPAGALTDIYIAGLQANATYELQQTVLGIPRGKETAIADEGGVLHLTLAGAEERRLRLRLLNEH